MHLGSLLIDEHLLLSLENRLYQNLLGYAKLSVHVASKHLSQM